MGWHCLDTDEDSLGLYSWYAHRRTAELYGQMVCSKGRNQYRRDGPDLIFNRGIEHYEIKEWVIRIAEDGKICKFLRNGGTVQFD